jgi:hypothetical protein
LSKKRLGKGLSALINNEENVDQNRVEEVFVDRVLFSQLLSARLKQKSIRL